jgi:hypothetical protein
VIQCVDGEVDEEHHISAEIELRTREKGKYKVYSNTIQLLYTMKIMSFSYFIGKKSKTILRTCNYEGRDKVTGSRSRDPANLESLSLTQVSLSNDFSSGVVVSGVVVQGSAHDDNGDGDVECH